MRIRNNFTSASSVPPSSPCSSSTTSSISTPPHSSSLASSTDSSSSSTPSTSSSSPFPSARCPGLDLLVKAIHQVTAGSIIGVPYIQKRVIRRRSRRRETFLSFDHGMVVLSEKIGGNEANRNALLKRQRRVMAVPTKYQDSVLQKWKPNSRYGRDLRKLVLK